jgi:hypothetical protein
MAHSMRDLASIYEKITVTSSNFVLFSVKIYKEFPSFVLFTELEYA